MQLEKNLLASLLVQSHSGDYRAIVDVICSFLVSRTDAKIILQKITKTKSNIIAVFGKPSFLINCHMDTVPPAGDWKTSPYLLTTKRNKLYGLGVADTKCNIYAVLKAVEQANPKNLMLLFSVDEEAEHISGVRAFLRTKHSTFIKTALVCEPTNLVPIWKHKGYAVFDFKVRTKPQHSSQIISGMNAIVLGSKLVNVLDTEGFNVGSICGGVAHNITAHECMFSASIRSYLGEKELLAKAKSCVLRANIKKSSFRLKYFEPCLNGKLFRMVKSVLGSLVSNPAEASFWSEAALFEHAGVPAFVFGAGSIAQAHTANEYVLTNQVFAAQNFFERLINKVCK